MRKKYQVPLWGIILLLLTGIGSITLTAWSNDSGVIKKSIDKVEKRVDKLEESGASKKYVDEKVEEIGSLQEAKMENLNTKIEAVKESTDRTEKMVGRLLDIQLNK